MLKITIPSNTDSNLNFAIFEQYNLPAPLDGVDAEINGDLILKFENEEEAVIYSEQLKNLSEGLDDKSSAAYLAIGDLIMAIFRDEFVQAYIEEN